MASAPGGLRSGIGVLSRAGSWTWIALFATSLSFTVMMVGAAGQVRIVAGALMGAMAVALYPVVGLCRLLDLGFAGFVCIGAYTYALGLQAGLPFPVAVALAGVSGGVAGVVLGVPTLHLRGDYFAVVTFGFSELVVMLIRNWPQFTGGVQGLSVLPPVLFGITISRFPPTSFAFGAIALATGVSCTVLYVRGSWLGAQMVAVGDDDVLAEATGVDVVGTKVAAFAFAAGLGGLCGAFWGAFYPFLEPPAFSLPLSVTVLAAVVIAGPRSIPLALVSGFFLGAVGDWLREWLEIHHHPPQLRMILHGAALLAAVLLREARARH